LCAEHAFLDERYGLLSNKGYGARKHMDGIRAHGITPWHRKTFGICKQF
jgi:ribonuclease HII